MARLSASELESIVARDLPGYTLVSRDPLEGAADHLTQAEDAAPELKVSKSKKKRRNSSSKRRSGGETPASDGQETPEKKVEDELVTVERKDAADPFDQGTLRKAVIISGEDGRVIGSQG
jgi:hypothetical protein